MSDLSLSASAHTPQLVPASRAVPSLLEDVRDGLLRIPRELPPKYFYDDHGSALFEAICETPEYYPTRAERALLLAHAREIVEAVRPQVMVELGSGVATKIGPLFEASAGLGLAVTYCPFDVCAAVLTKSAALLTGRYAGLTVSPLQGDFTAGLDHLPVLAGPTLYMFLGGTIGNFTDPAALALLREIRALMRPTDRLLLGADRVKAMAVLNAAYNDAAGYTAAFNLNVLSVLNAGVGANFVPSQFAHRAFYNEQEAQIEMHLVSREAQTVELPALNTRLQLAAGDSIRTEISRKFSPDALQKLLASAGFAIERYFTGEDEAFSLVLAAPTAA